MALPPFINARKSVNELLSNLFITSLLKLTASSSFFSLREYLVGELYLFAVLNPVVFSCYAWGGEGGNGSNTL